MIQQSATARKTSQQCKERWLHVPSNHEYLITLEIAGACELEGIDRHAIYRKRDELESSEIWRRIP